MLWTDDSLRELIRTDYPWLLPTYDAYPYDTQRWDASRYAILHKYGGESASLPLAAPSHPPTLPHRSLTAASGPHALRSSLTRHGAARPLR